MNTPDLKLIKRTDFSSGRFIRTFENPQGIDRRYWVYTNSGHEYFDDLKSALDSHSLEEDRVREIRD